ncbi:DUF1566 domain-containing protein [Leptospira adleri]|uniref:Lcl C-terminal domain-containing protein n=1 Tax=Leptospira adleri TaxID=2023186 RepID=A0A2M9YQ73_9LEPT|nr:DUF1566 domain-containing protein [Leptospira adleri]PJZ53688.1 hypothetical protein CH380_08860 [Leptospira adleri]PJZ61221.1 hypothetical protein CH376_14470 [Leptospira adleri]
MRFDFSFRFPFLSILVVLFFIMGCKEKTPENACDPSSEAYLEAAILSSASGNLFPVCAPAPQSLSYPKAVFANGSPISLVPSVAGSGLSFSVSPSLPAGVSLDSFSGLISGSYIGYSGVDSIYRIKASNSSGSIGYSLELILYGSAPLKTGQTVCTDAGGTVISCSGTKQDGELQNGTSPSFSGPNLISGTDYTTTDNLTGLIWKSCNEGLSGSACGSGGLSSLSRIAADTACTNLNAGAGYANRTDWRLPSAKELETILNYDGSSPASYATFFPATSPSGHWSSSAFVPLIGTDSWYVSFTDGVVRETTNGNTNPLRCVSGSTTPAPLFKDNGDATITDVNTGLIWAQCSAGLSGIGCATGIVSSPNWTNALLTCNSLSLAGRVWRLPSVNELRSLTNLSLQNPILNSTYFPGTFNGNYWTSTTYTNPVNAWSIDFGQGFVDSIAKGATAAVRCVTTGP